MPNLTDDEPPQFTNAEKAARERRHRTTPEDRRVRTEMMRVARMDEPPVEPEESAYWDDLKEKLKL